MGIAFIVTLATTELHSVIDDIYPKAKDIYLDVFLKPGYHNKQVNIPWHLHFLTNDLFAFTGFAIAAFSLMKTNLTLAIIFYVAAVYKVLDVWLYIWDYKTDYYIYWVVISLVFIASYFILRPVETGFNGRVIKMK